MAAGNAIASGAVILTANADGLANGLQKSQGQVIDWGNKTAVEATKATEKIGTQVEQGFDHTQKKLNKAFNKFAKHEGGFAGMVGVGLLGDIAPALMPIAAGITGLVLLGRQFGESVWEWARGTKGVEEAMKRSREELDLSSQLMQKNAKLADEWRAAFTDPTDKVSSFDAEIRNLEADLAKLTSGPEWFQQKRFLTPGEALLMESTKGQLVDAEAVKKRVAEIKARLVELDEAKGRVISPIHDPAFIGEINKATAALEKEIDAWGLTAQAAMRADFVKRGAIDEVLTGLDAANKKAKELAAGNSLQPWAMGMLGLLDPIAERLGELFKPQNAPPWMAMALHTLEQVGNETDRIMGKYQQVYEPMLGTMLRILGVTAQGLTAGNSFDLSKLVDHNKIAESNKFAGAAIKGSLEDYTLTVRNKFDSEGMKAEKDKTADAVKESNKRLDKALDKLDDLNKGVRDWGVI